MACSNDKPARSSGFAFFCAIVRPVIRSGLYFFHAAVDPPPIGQLGDDGLADPHLVGRGDHHAAVAADRDAVSPPQHRPRVQRRYSILDGRQKQPLFARHRGYGRPDGMFEAIGFQAFFAQQAVRLDPANLVEPAAETVTKALNAAVDGLANAEGHLVDPLGRRGGKPSRGLEDGAGGQSADLLARQFHAGLQLPLDPPLDCVDPVENLDTVRHRDHAGLGRRRGAGIGHKIGDGGVDLVADGADDGDLRGGDGPSDDLLVERPEVLQRAAAAANDQDFQPQSLVAAVEFPDRSGDLACGGIPLHGNRIQEHFGARPAGINTIGNVLDRGAGRAGDDADPHRVARQGFFAGLVEETLGGKALLHLLEGQLQGADAGRLETVGIKLIPAAGEIDIDVAGRDHGHAGFGTELDLAKVALPHHAGKDRVGILEGKVAMAAGDLPEVAELAGDGQAAGEPLFQGDLDQRRHLGDRVNPYFFPCGGHGGQSSFKTN